VFDYLICNSFGTDQGNVKVKELEDLKKIYVCVLEGGVNCVQVVLFCHDDNFLSSRLVATLYLLSAPILKRKP
jgi:hypothetical protein